MHIPHDFGHYPLIVTPIIKFLFFKFNCSLIYCCREVVEGDEFLALSHHQVCKLICSDRLAVKSEEKVMDLSISCIFFPQPPLWILRTISHEVFNIYVIMLMVIYNVILIFRYLNVWLIG